MTWGPLRITDPGDMVVTRIRADDPNLWGTDREFAFRIDRADPIILICEEMMAELTGPGHHPAVTCEGDVLTFAAVNGTFSYEIGDYDQQRHAFFCTRRD